MAKIKTKTHSGAKKRFKMTASGKVKYQKTNKRHRLTQKDTKRKKSLVPLVSLTAQTHRH